MYWNIKNSLSHNCLFNFIVGDRGVGKTYGCKKWAIEDFLKTGAQFIYLRRYQTELKRTNKFFDDILLLYGILRLKYKKYGFVTLKALLKKYTVTSLPLDTVL